MNLYVHVPFCIKKCNYCAFHSTCLDAIDWDGYADDVLRQLNEFRIGDYEIKTLFFGGGTPSLMPAEYAGKIVSRLNLSAGAEWTLEANPKTLNSNELKDWRDLGLTRLSVGMQSFRDDELRFLGRVHTAADGLALISGANDLNLRVNADFIYGLPAQKISEVEKLCKKINGMGLKSASLYELTFERGTRFQNMSPVSETVKAEMYTAIQNTLKLPRYEISNYGDPCRHNMNIWRGEEYIGVGESAAGRIIKNGGWIETKIAGGRIVENVLTERDRAIEITMTGLRTKWGVDRAVADKVVNGSFVERNPDYFIKNDGFLKMSDAGLLLLDGLMPDVIK